MFTTFRYISLSEPVSPFKSSFCQFFGFPAVVVGAVVEKMMTRVICSSSSEAETCESAKVLQPLKKDKNQVYERPPGVFSSYS